MGMVMMIGLQHSLNIENVESRRNFHEQIYHRVSPIVMYISHMLGYFEGRLRHSICFLSLKK